MPWPSPDVRFWSKVDKSGGPDACWPWVGARARKGYGTFWFGGRMIVATHYAWMIEYGPLPPVMDALHACDNPPCVNVRHLFAGDDSANARDCVAKGRRAATSSLFGELNPAAKLNRESVSEIRRRAARGELYRVLARDFGVSKTAVSFAVNMKTWDEPHRKEGAPC